MGRNNGQMELIEINRRPPSFVTALRHLLGHILGTAILFFVVMLVAWSISYGLNALDAIHPFPATIHTIIERVEVALLVGDIAISGFVVLLSAIRFLKAI